MRRDPGPGEVEIEVEAAALNFIDVMKAIGTYPDPRAGPASSAVSAPAGSAGSARA